MSYILDALKRADAERERGTIPGIHAQPALGWPDQAPHPSSSRRALWLVVGVATLLSIPIAWRFWGDQSSRRAPAEAVTTVAPMLSPRVLPTPVATDLKVAPVRDVAVEVTPRRAVAPRTEPVTLPRKPPGSGTMAIAVAAPPPAEARTPLEIATVDDKVYALSEMPAEIRRELPALTITGAIYSENVANRFLIINGQVFHETETPVPGVVLQKIKLKSAVLSFKGYRYSINY